jgi:hypothetical protein
MGARYVAVDDQPGKDDPLSVHVEALDREIAHLHAELHPPQRPPDSVVNTVVQMGVGFARAGAPLQEPAKSSAEGTRRVQRMMWQVAAIAFVLIGGGLLGGFLWDPSSAGRALETHLLVGGVVGVWGGFLLVVSGWMMIYATRSAWKARRSVSTHQQDT